MWNSSQSAGFMNSSLSSPSAQGSNPSGGKAKRAQNIVPVKIEEVLNAPEEGFQIEGVEVGMICILGKVTDVDIKATKTTYKVEDNTGSVEVVHWVTEEGASTPKVPEGSSIRVVGSIRTQGENKHVMGFGIMDAMTEAERDNHDLKVVFSHLKLKQLNAKLSGGQTGTMDNSGLSNSMMGSGVGANFGGGGSSFSSSFGNKNYDTVYALIKQSQDDQGINISSILQSVQGKMSKSEMDSAIDYLSNEGHIYSTVDDEHFKSTDGD